jgi:hypothetical protein
MKSFMMVSLSFLFFAVSCHFSTKSESMTEKRISPEKFSSLYMAGRPYADHWKFIGSKDGKLMLEHWVLMPRGSVLQRKEIVYCLENEIDPKIFTKTQLPIQYGTIPFIKD